MVPAMKVDDAQFIASAGIDALVAVRVLSYGGLLFIPVGLAGIAICKWLFVLLVSAL